MTKKGKRMVGVLLAGLFVCGGVTAYGLWENKQLEIHEYVVKSAHLPSAFDGFRIAQVSDLHNAQIGKENEKLLSMLQATEADVIVLTGDMVDSVFTDVAVATAFAYEVVKIAPTYYVTGNHEAKIGKKYTALEKGMTEAGVQVLSDEESYVERDGEYIRFLGVNDPNFEVERIGSIEKEYMQTVLQRFSWTETYTVLLSHRPELFEVYAEVGADLVFAGHAHGGQFRIFGEGIFAPDQGFFPKYAAGRQEKGRTTMLVSRGVGNSLFPFRLNNPPEIVVAELQN